MMARACNMPATVHDGVVDAARWCERWLRLYAMASPHKPAAVFDIDATLIDASGRAIAETCELVHLCRALRIAVFYVTARSERGREYTEDQLRRLKIDCHKRLYMHPAHSRCDTNGAGRQKLRAREQIEKHGYSIGLNAGDAWHDHLHPVSHELARLVGGRSAFVFVAADGAAHLKMPE